MKSAIFLSVGLLSAPFANAAQLDFYRGQHRVYQMSGASVDLASAGVGNIDRIRLGDPNQVVVLATEKNLGGGLLIVCGSGNLDLADYQFANRVKSVARIVKRDAAAMQQEIKKWTTGRKFAIKRRAPLNNRSFLFVAEVFPQVLGWKKELFKNGVFRDILAKKNKDGATVYSRVEMWVKGDRIQVRARVVTKASGTWGDRAEGKAVLELFDEDRKVRYWWRAGRSAKVGARNKFVKKERNEDRWFTRADFAKIYNYQMRSAAKFKSGVDEFWEAQERRIERLVREYASREKK